MREYAAGKVEFRNDAGGNVHSVVGKVSFPKEKLTDNINAMISAGAQDEAADQQGRSISRRS